MRYTINDRNMVDVYRSWSENRMINSRMLDLQTLLVEFSSVFATQDQDVELIGAEQRADGSLQMHTRLRSTWRTTNINGTIFGGSLFTLADITGALAMSLAVIDLIRKDNLLIFGSTRGGSITYVQAAKGDVDCTLTLSSALLRSIPLQITTHRRTTCPVSVAMHTADKTLVASAALTLAARQIDVRVAERLPAVGQVATRLREVATGSRMIALGS